MASIFSKIRAGEIPGEIVWDDGEVFSLVPIAPLSEGHVLVIPDTEFGHWIDLDHSSRSHLMDVAQLHGQILQELYQPTKVGLMIAGLEVDHVHLHVTPINDVTDLDFAQADAASTPEYRAAYAQRLRDHLRSLGHVQHVRDGAAANA